MNKEEKWNNENIEIKIIDSHRMAPASYKEDLMDFFCEVKGIPEQEACNFVKYMIYGFELEFQVAWIEVVAYAEGKIVGFMRLLCNPENRVEWYACDVHVRKAYRFRGYATQMYRMGIEVIKEYDSAETIYASVLNTNINSIGLHTKLGFTKVQNKKQFCNFITEEAEDTYLLKLYTKYPAKNNDYGKKTLLPLWTKFAQEKKKLSDMECLEDLNRHLDSIDKDEIVIFEIVWRGNRVVGFEYTSKDEKIVFMDDKI